MRRIFTLLSLCALVSVVCLAQSQQTNLLTQGNWLPLTGSGAPSVGCPTSVTGGTVYGSTTVTGLSGTAGIRSNQIIISGTEAVSFPAGTYVVSVNITTNTVVLSAPASSTITSAPLNFSNYGQPYTDISNSAQYVCTNSGWTLQTSASAVLPVNNPAFTGTLTGPNVNVAGNVAATTVSQAADATAASSGLQDATMGNLRQYGRSVKEWGAVCDGNTDDTAALNAALAAVGGTSNALLIPAGATCYTEYGLDASGTTPIIGDTRIFSPTPTSNYAYGGTASVIAWGSPANDAIVSNANVLTVSGITFIQLPATSNGTVTATTLNSITLSNLSHVHQSTFTATAITTGLTVYGHSAYTAAGKIYRVVSPLSPYVITSGDIPSFSGTGPTIGTLGTTQTVGSVTWEYLSTGTTYQSDQYSPNDGSGRVWIFFGTSGNTLTSVTQSNYTSSTTPTAITLGVGGSFYSSGYSANASNSGANQSAAIHITGGGNSPTITHNWFNLLPGAAVRIDSGQGMYFRENTVDTVGYGLLGSLANVQSQDNQFFNCFIDCISNTVGTTSMNSINFMSTGDSMQQSNQFGDGFALSDSTYIPVGTDSLVDWCTIKNVFMRNYFNAMVLKGLKGCVISGNIARNGGTALSVTNSDHNTFSDLHIAGQEGATLAPYIALSGTQANIFNNVSTFNVTTDYVNYNITGAALTDFTLNTWLGDAFNPGAVTNNQGFVFTAEQNLPSGSLSVTSLLRKNALIHTDDSNEATPAITVNGLTTPAKTLALGYDTTKNQAYVQAYWNDVGTSPVALNPGGGDVLVATSTDCGSALCVFGNSVLTGYGKATNFISTAQAAISGTDCLQIDVSGYIANSGSPCSAVSSHTGTTGTITGTALAATCDSGTAGVTGAVVGHPVMVSSTTGVDVGGTFNVRGSVTSTGVVTVYVCGTGTPASLAYNVTVF